MSHLLKYTEWQGASSKWYATDVSDFSHGSFNWWYVPRMLNMELVDYIQLLKNDFHASFYCWKEDSNTLLWRWEKYSDCHNFVLFVNREARKRKFFI